MVPKMPDKRGSLTVLFQTVRPTSEVSLFLLLYLIIVDRSCLAKSGTLEACRPTRRLLSESQYYHYDLSI
jgi:hypothetical protein